MSSSWNVYGEAPHLVWNRGKASTEVRICPAQAWFGVYSGPREQPCRSLKLFGRWKKGSEGWVMQRAECTAPLSRGNANGDLIEKELELNHQCSPHTSGS